MATELSPPVAAPAAPKGRMPLAWRIFLASAALIVAALGTAVFITWNQSRQIATEAVDRALTASAEVQREFAQRRLGDVQMKTELLAADPAFVQYVADAQAQDLGLGDDAPTGAASIVDLLRERQETQRFDLGIVLDTEGRILARTDQSELLDASLAGDPFVEPVLAELSPVGGFWREGDVLYQAALMPLAQKDDLVGFLLLALRVDDALGTQVGKVSGADVAFFLPTAEGGPVLIGSSLAEADAKALAAAVAGGSGGVQAALAEGRAVDRTNLDFGNQRWSARLAPVDADGGARLGATLQLFSTDRAAAGYRELANRLALVAVIALLIALPVSFLLAKRSLRPLKRMADAAHAAADGDYRADIRVGGNDELATLSQAFDQLLSDLREKRDIEGYVSNLSRFLPDPAQDIVRIETPAAASAVAAPAERAQRLLLGLDLRAFARAPESADAASALDAFRQTVARVHRAAEAHGGALVGASGTRLTYAFSGDARLQRALFATHGALESDASTAAALVEGDVLSGGAIVGATNAPVAIGPAAYQLERLLGESASGRVLLPRTLGDATKTLLGEAQVSVAQGVASGKPFYAVSPQGLAALVPPAGFDARDDDGNASRGDEPGGDDRGSHDGGDVTVVRPAVSAPAPAPAKPRSEGLRPGARFGGRYEILSVLGEGGMGVVYKARDLELDDVVALKMLKPAALADSEHLERLKSEIKLARKITHPNVLRTFDFGESEGRPYISMEYVRGMILRFLIAQAGRIPYSAGLRIARQLCAGLAAAHEVGVLHRDIKPENLILEQSGNAKLMDFGIARPLRRAEPGQTAPGMFVGTPNYSAPEQLTGSEVDARADVYGSGVLLCEMFSAHLPYEGDNTMEIYMAQMQKPPTLPSAYWPDIPPALEAIIAKAIARDPNERYQSAKALGEALESLRA